MAVVRKMVEFNDANFRKKVLHYCMFENPVEE